MIKKAFIIVFFSAAFIFLTKNLVRAQQAEFPQGGALISLNTDQENLTEAEDNQLFPVFVDINTQEALVSGLDITILFDNTKLQALKVLPGNAPSLNQGYFGASSKVDTDSTCKENTQDQTNRLRCAINQEAGRISITALALDANSTENPVPTKTPVSGQFRLATIIFMPKNGAQNTGEIKITYSNADPSLPDLNNNSLELYSLAYSAEENSRQVLSFQTESAPSINLPIKNLTTCDTDFDRSGNIWGQDISAIFTDFANSRSYASNNGFNVDKACDFYYCKTDVNSDGKIWGEDISALFSEYAQESCQL